MVFADAKTCVDCWGLGINYFFKNTAIKFQKSSEAIKISPKHNNFPPIIHSPFSMKIKYKLIINPARCRINQSRPPRHHTHAHTQTHTHKQLTGVGISGGRENDQFWRFWEEI